MESFADFDNTVIIPPKAPVDEEGKPIERWTPLGANDSTEICVDTILSISECANSDEFRSITEERARLNSSLLLLTSHFAQVQFRLEQVLQADSDEKEALLRDLEQFAWKGLPDIHWLKHSSTTFDSPGNESTEEQHRKNIGVIIDLLKSQLHDLEQFAYKSGEIQQPPTQSVLERQRFVLEELGKHIGLNVSEFHSLTEEAILERVRAVLSQSMSTMRTNVALVDQLKTQIVDLERFMDFLREEGTPDSAIGKALEAFRRYQQEVHIRTTSQSQLLGEECKSYGEGGYHIGLSRKRPNAKKTVGLINRALTMLQVFATLQLADRHDKVKHKAGKDAGKGTSGKTGSPRPGSSAEHWGDMRARLEVAIDAVLDKAERLRQVRQAYQNRLDVSSREDSERDPRISKYDISSLKYQAFKPRNSEYSKAERELNLTVRRQFCPALEVLIEHGSRLPAVKRVYSTDTASDGGARSASSLLGSLLSILGCFSRNRVEGLGYSSNLTSVGLDDDDASDEDDYDDSGENPETEASQYYLQLEAEKRARLMRRKNAQSSAWNIFLKYYILTNGRAFNDTPARKLSDSFALDIIGGKVVTSKQHLLSSMGTVLHEFNKYKRSDEAQFKALVCIGLNTHRLVSWLKLVLRSPLIVQYMYHPWSYVTSTGFDDALQSLNRLTTVDFDLSFDANIRHLQSSSEAF